MSAALIDELDQAGIDALVSSINIPPQPQLLQEIQQELSKPEPDPQVIVNATSRDVALTAAILKVVNSPFFGLRRQADSLSQATMLLGLRALSGLVTGLLARQALDVSGPAMARFWDVSAKRAAAMQYLARKLRMVEPDQAQTFGLLCDLGIPLLTRKFPAYLETLGLANDSTEQSFVEVEQARHHTDHALVGAIMAKTWGLSPLLAVAIRAHHDYERFGTADIPEAAQDLVAMGLLAERIIQTYAGQNRTAEWARGGEAALTQLGLSSHDFDELQDEVHAQFSAG